MHKAVVDDNPEEPLFQPDDFEPIRCRYPGAAYSENIHTQHQSPSTLYGHESTGTLNTYEKVIKTGVQL
jgi:hypothetical protein